MAEHHMSDLIRTSLDSLRDFTGADTFIGEAIDTPSGVTVIPVSRVTIAFATGGVDYGTRRISQGQNFGGGGGTGVTITPIAFLTVNTAQDVRLVPIEPSGIENTVEKVVGLIEKAPELIGKIKQILF